MTDPESYRVVFSAELLPGHEPAAVKQRLARAFSMQLEAIEGIFTGKPVVIRANLSLDQAKQYHKVFSSAGAVLKVQAVRTQTEDRPGHSPATPPTTPPTSTRPGTETSPAAGRSSRPPTADRVDSGETICPKCGFRQPHSDSCLACGIVFERFLQRQQQLAEQAPEPAAPLRDQLEEQLAPAVEEPPPPEPAAPVEPPPAAAAEPVSASAEPEQRPAGSTPADESYPPLFDIAPIPIVGLVSSLMLSLCLHLVVIGISLGPRIIWDFVISHVKLDDSKLGCTDSWLWLRVLLFAPYSMLVVLVVGVPGGWGLAILGDRQPVLAGALTVLLAILLLPLALAPLHLGLVQALAATTQLRTGDAVFAPYASARPVAFLRLLTSRWREVLLGSLAVLAYLSLYLTPVGLAITLGALFSQLRTDRHRYRLAVPWKMALKYSLLNLPTFGIATLFFVRKYFDEALPSGQWLPLVQQERSE